MTASAPSPREGRGSQAPTCGRSPWSALVYKLPLVQLLSVSGRGFVLLIALASMMAGGTHLSAAAPVHTEKAIREPGAAAHREDALVTALMLLLSVTGRPLSKEEVAGSLNVELTVLRNLGADGITYAGDNSVDGWHAEFFTRANRFNVSVSFRGLATNTGAVSIDRIRTELVARGWTRGTPITHPFMLDTFAKRCRNVRVEHDGERTLQIELFNVC